MADKLDPEKVMRATGHLTRKVFDGYNHGLESSLDEVAKTGAEVFSNILQFRRAV
jgi:hypothetical protein